LSANLGAIPMASAGPDIPIRTLTDTPYGETQPAVSPDGRFVAYLSGESGRDEVVLSPLLPGPRLGPTTPVSSGGASDVRWGRDGSSLFYESADHRIQTVPVRTSPALQIGTPRTIWDLSALRIASAGWDLMPDGRLIGLQMREDEGEGKQIDLVLHFDQEVKRKIPR
jgi:eukaryotic-like serine/threonine-protein kinase